MGYLVKSWNPWDCIEVYKKIFISKEDADEYVANYDLNKEIEEELEIIEVEMG